VAASAGYGDDGECAGYGCDGEGTGAAAWRRAAAASPAAAAAVFLFFLKNLCRVSLLALGKVFAECPTNDTQQTVSLPAQICRVSFAVCYTRQTPCRHY